MSLSYTKAASYLEHPPQTDRAEALETVPKSYATELAQPLRENSDELVRLSKEHEELKHSHDQLESANKRLAAAKDKIEHDLYQLGLRTTALQKELQACKDDIFRLQPVVQTTDTEIVSQFGAICEQISSWIDEEISYFERGPGFGKEMPLFLCGGDQKLAALMKSHPKAGEYIIGSLIHEHLQSEILGQHNHLFGLPQESIFLLRITEESMVNLKPPRDLNTISTWRSETLRALANAPETRHQQEVKAQHITTKIFNDIEAYFPIIRGQEKSLRSFYERVILPAVQLAIDVRVSTTPYEWYPNMSGPKPRSWKKIASNALNFNSMIDVETRKALKVDSPVVSDKNGYIGVPVLLVEPGLVRRSVGKERPKTLRPPTYLLELFFPLGKRR